MNGTRLETAGQRKGLIARPTVVQHRRLLLAERKPAPVDIPRMAEAIEADYQFRLGMVVIRSLILATPTRIAVAADSNPSDGRADKLAENLTAHWREMLPHALNAFGHGRAAFERTYRHDGASDLFVVDGLDYLPYERTRLVLTREGSFAGIELVGRGERILLEPARAWWFALDPTVTAPHGRSRYLGAPLAVWKARRRLEQLEEVWFQRFALGHGIARAPEREPVDPLHDQGGISAVDGSGAPIDPMEVMRQKCVEIESGGVLVLSSQTGADGKYLYDYTPTDGQKDSAPLENRRRMLDAAALRSLGVPERALTQDADSGSYALAEVHRQVLGQTCEGILEQLANSFQKYVIEKAVAVNTWPGSSPRLCVERRPVGDGEREAAASLVRDLLTQPMPSPLIGEGRLDLARLFALADLPIRSAEV